MLVSLGVCGLIFTQTLMPTNTLQTKKKRHTNWLPSSVQYLPTSWEAKSGDKNPLKQ